MIRLTTVPTAVYIHIPFCTNKCYYCDFNSYVLKGQPVMRYLEALVKEMERTVKKAPPHAIETIFVGGGTPTVLLPDEMEYFLEAIKTWFPTRSDRFEFTMEANPGTVDEHKLKVMKAGGVNRLSFGVQTFQNSLLNEIGRIHNTDDVYQSIQLAQQVGFDNLSIDLMFGLPNQTLDMLDESLNEALKLDLMHYSVYGLKVEENTLFHKLYIKDRLPLPDEDTELEMYKRLMQRFRAAGYQQYEISNFAKSGYESRHNTMYWRNRSYYGIGAGAHGYVFGERHVNMKGVQEYIDASSAGLPRLDYHEVDQREAMEDFMMVGLRMLNGVRRSDFEDQFAEDMDRIFGVSLRQLLQKGLLEQTGDGYRLSEQGILFGNEVFAEFIS